MVVVVVVFVIVVVVVVVYLSTKLFCGTCSIFEVESVKNAAILRDYLNLPS